MSTFKQRILMNGSIHIDDVNEILKNKEKAEKWDEATTVKGYEEFLENKDIVECLKKRIEECETNSLKISAKDNWAEYKNQITLLPELKKIVGEKK